MDTKALRQKILDLAIRGKLVPQDPNDEPASVLLECIRAEKQQMVKEGKLKAKDIKNDTIIYVGEDNLHYEKFQDGSVKCIEDEIPFELPEGWCWTRLGCITDVIQYGLSNSAESAGDYRLLRITDIQDGSVNWDSVPFTSTNEPEKYLLHKEDIVFARTGATVGKSFLIKDVPFASVYASYLIRIRLIYGISANYVYQFFNSYCYWSQITDKSVGVGQPNCNGTSLKELLIPLPPQREQDRIVPAANNLLKISDIISSEREQLSEVIQTTKAKILDLAIRGKLVPQNPDDEPASVLLERIRAEKEELIKQGKIKRDKKESVIFKGGDNSYYGIKLPRSWCWACLKDIALSISDGSHNPPSDKGYGIPLLSAANISNQILSIEKASRWITNEEWIIENQRTHIELGDVLLTIVGTIGRSAVVQTDKNFALQRSVAVIKPCLINSFYLMHIVQAPQIQKWLLDNSKGTAQKGIYLNALSTMMVPIPPLAEQTQIVEKIDAALKYLNSISNDIA